MGKTYCLRDSAGGRGYGGFWGDKFSVEDPLEAWGPLGDPSLGWDVSYQRTRQYGKRKKVGSENFVPKGGEMVIGGRNEPIELKKRLRERMAGDGL